MQTNKWDTIWVNATVCTCENKNGFLTQAAVACKDGNIAWVGPMQALPAVPENLANHVIDVKQQLITPGLIDCHTHLVFAGNRAHEFELRLQGVTYEEIAKQGGGIQSTVNATRQASEEELYQQSLFRARQLLLSGVTTVEIKSGYGLDWDTEVKMLRVASRIGEVLPLTVKRTFLGAHVVPAEYNHSADEYVDIVCQRMIPQIAKEAYADSVDVFCEHIAFNVEQTEKIFQAAARYGLQLKCHAEQLSDSGAAILAAKYNACSVDHLEYISEKSVCALAKSGTVAVLLPGAFYFLREKRVPPVELLRQYQVPMAIATDCNPGTSPTLSLTLMMNMACTLLSFTPEEALLGVTINAAKALGLQDRVGSISIGKAADLAIWQAETPAELVYYIGGNLLNTLIINGKLVQFD